jgi:hypothetical protein
VQNDGFFAYADDAVDAVEDLVLDQFEDDEARVFVQAKFLRGSVLFLVAESMSARLFMLGVALQAVEHFVGQLKIEVFAVAGLEIRRERQELASVFAAAHCDVMLRDDAAVLHFVPAGRDRIELSLKGVESVPVAPIAHVNHFLFFRVAFEIYKTCCNE